MPNHEHNEKAREAWEANSRFWDEHMGEGNDFFNLLEWPAVERLLKPQQGERLLDIACGNGLTSRRLARAGADVLAFDFSEAMIAIAKQRSEDGIDYRVIDATDRDALINLGAGSFDGALCNMGLMDMADIQPLMDSLAVLLRPQGRFVFSVIHPCFNNPSSIMMGETEDRGGTVVTTYSVKTSRYLTSFMQSGIAMPGQPVPHPYFHRSMSTLFGAAFKAGLVLDAMAEPAFPPEYRGGSFPISWNGHLSEIPPVLVTRLVPGTTRLQTRQIT
jgi:2-polyprenyl-3-methyl-5-hydroxy-6-metoxy-1,4-benzoquinol methylase